MTVQDMIDQGVQNFLNGSYEKSRNLASRACNTDPDSAFPHRLLGELYHLHLGSISLAMKYYEEAHSKGDAGATTNLGVLCKDKGDVVRARLLYEEAQRKGDLNATVNLGIL